MRNSSEFINKVCIIWHFVNCECSNYSVGHYYAKLSGKVVW